MSRSFVVRRGGRGGGRGRNTFNPLQRPTPARTQPEGAWGVTPPRRGGPGGRGPGGRGTGDAMSLKLIKLVLQKRFNKDSRFLDLTNLVSDQDITDINPDFNSLHFTRKLAKVLKDEYAQSLDTISFAHNNIKSLRPLAMALKAEDVKLQNVALTKNNVSDLKEIDELSCLELREVILQENPVAGKGDVYHRHAVKALKSIQLLDGIAVGDWRKDLLPKVPQVTSPSCFHSPELESKVTAFAKAYFELVDRKDWNSLADAYAPNVPLFSVCVPRDLKFSNIELNQHFISLIALDHNCRVQHKGTNVRNVQNGKTAITAVLSDKVYPKTVVTAHPIDTFKADVIPMGQAILATVHGKLDFGVKHDNETTMVSLCFDRTWLLQPAQGGNWPYVIANDQLKYRKKQEHAVLMQVNSDVAQGAQQQQQPAPTTATTGNNQAQMFAQLKAATGLKDDFVNTLIKESQGNWETAMALFATNQEALKSNGAFG